MVVGARVFVALPPTFFYAPSRIFNFYPKKMEIHNLFSNLFSFIYCFISLRVRNFNQSIRCWLENGKKMFSEIILASAKFAILPRFHRQTLITLSFNRCKQIKWRLSWQLCGRQKKFAIDCTFVIIAICARTNDKKRTKEREKNLNQKYDHRQWNISMALKLIILVGMGDGKFALIIICTTAERNQRQRHHGMVTKTRSDQKKLNF